MGVRPCASRPQRIATNGPPRATRARIAASVISSQPLPRCDPGVPGATVSTLLSSRTPWSAHGLRSPVSGRAQPRSSWSSRKMLLRLRGIGRTSGATENDSPTAWPGVGYGSCPTMRTRTPASGRVKARSTLGPAGRYPRPAASSARRKSPMSLTRPATGARACAQSGATSSSRGRRSAARDWGVAAPDPVVSAGAAGADGGAVVPGGGVRWAGASGWASGLESGVRSAWDSGGGAEAGCGAEDSGWLSTSGSVSASACVAIPRDPLRELVMEWPSGRQGARPVLLTRGLTSRSFWSIPTHRALLRTNFALVRVDRRAEIAPGSTRTSAKFVLASPHRPPIDPNEREVPGRRGAVRRRAGRCGAVRCGGGAGGAGRCGAVPGGARR